MKQIILFIDLLFYIINCFSPFKFIGVVTSLTSTFINSFNINFMPKTILGTKNTDAQLYSRGRELTRRQIYASTLFPIVSVMEKN